MGERFICPNCGNIFDSNYVRLVKDRFGEYLCPIRECGGTPFIVDEMMIHPIMELNKRGIITYKCCSGHIDDISYLPYILIDGNTPIESRPDLWTIDVSNTINHVNDFEIVEKRNIALRYYEPVETKPYTQERINSIYKAMTSLYDWINNKLSVSYNRIRDNND